MLHSPNYLSDPLSSLLSLVEARPTISGGFLAGGRWALRFPPTQDLKVIVIVRGRCLFGQKAGDITTWLSQGDVILLARCGPFVVASDDEVSPEPAGPLFAGSSDSIIRIGTGDDFFYAGGHVALDATLGHLVTDGLAAVTIVRHETGRLRTTEWLIRRIIEERRIERPGATLASKALAELLVIEVLRNGRSEVEPAPAGWLSGYADARLAPSFRVIHDQPARSWHVAELAQLCGMSRSSFAGHFSKTTGITPLAYLTAWRIRTAQRMLTVGTASIGDIAHTVGYSSDSAFSTAFKQIVGSSPRYYRRSIASDCAHHLQRIP